MAKNPDPFDVEALERSLNDSATRVSTIWISFLLFGLYLAVAANTVTHRQLLLEDPIKLPALSVDLPLIGFFFLAPMLFVVFHIYVLLQVLLLGRTAATYNGVLDRTVKESSRNAVMRQRLANTLFSQIFAGSPREREGWLGSLLRMMAWLTLAIAPVLVLLAFQLTFLPYHSHVITWTLRLLIMLDLIVVLVLWRAARQPDRDLSWRLAFQGWVGWSSAIALIAFSWIAVNFPGERHAEWARLSLKGESQESRVGSLRECDSISVVDDRLMLPGVDVVDMEKLARIQKDRTELRAWEAKINAPRKYTHSFRDRDLNCANLLNADLRRVDLTRAELRGAQLQFAGLEGADFTETDLQGANLDNAALDDTFLIEANLRQASLQRTELRRAYLAGAKLQGASLRFAQLHGAALIDAWAQGADFSRAELEGAYIYYTRLQGALLNSTYLPFARFIRAQLQGADLTKADLSAAFLDGVGLQGADLNESAMQYTILFQPRVWRTKNAACTDTRVDSQLSDAVLPDLRAVYLQLGVQTVPGTPDNIAKFIEESVADISDAKLKQAAIDRMRSGLDPGKDDTAGIEEVWRKCGENSQQVSRADFEKRSGAFHRTLFCDTKKRVCARNFDCDVNKSVNAIGNAILDREKLPPEVWRWNPQLVGGMLDENETCPANQVLDGKIKARLREVISRGGL
jgi:uncharacterized protein YjbI with pentapeptide repeats